MASSSRYACAPGLELFSDRSPGHPLQSPSSDHSILESLYRRGFAALRELGRNIDLQRVEANDLQEVELAWKTWLTLLIRYGRVIPTRPGPKEKRYVQLLFGEPEFDLSAAWPARLWNRFGMSPPRVLLVRQLLRCSLSFGSNTLNLRHCCR